MKKTGKYFGCIVLLFILCLVACEKDSVKGLPPETQTGENTFGCEINNRIWVPNGDTLAHTDYVAEYYKSTQRLYIAVRQALQDETVIIKHQAADTGVHSFWIADGVLLDYLSAETSTCHFSSGSIQTGFLNIQRLDTAEKIVSGKFHVYIDNSGCPQLKVLDGRFDLRMQVYN